MPYMEDCLDWPLSRVLPLLQQRIMEGSSYHGIPTMKSPLDFWIYQEISGKPAGFHNRTWQSLRRQYPGAGTRLRCLRQRKDHRDRYHARGRLSRRPGASAHHAAYR